MPRVTLLRNVVHRGRSSSKELAESIGVTTADLPGLLGKLEAEGFVTRTRSTTDRRVVHVQATPKGERKLESLRRAAMRELAKEFAGWSDRDLRSLRDLLAKVGSSYCDPSCGPTPRVLTKRRTGSP